MKIKDLFKKPQILAVIGDVNQAKSMTIYHLLNTLREEGDFKLYTYGLKTPFPDSTSINSVGEMEMVRGSVIVVDELSSLFDLDNRKVKKSIESSLRLINHNNNVLILSATAECFKKFLSAKVNMVIYKKVTFKDFINGSRVKHIATNYCGVEKGSEVLNIPVNEALCYDGKHYHKLMIPYLEQFDSKKCNKPIFVVKSVPEIVQKKIVP